MINAATIHVRNLAIRYSLLLICAAVAAPNIVHAHGTAQTPNQLGNRAITFPDTETYQTLVVDLHTHSVFSDGQERVVG